MTDLIVPGLLVLHGNRLELLQDAVFAWIGRQPLAPLEQEIFLVQSNGIAEWLKMSLARHEGICAAVTMELPARFVWRAYARMLGRENVPATSALDKAPLTWRLMRLLPALLARPEFAPLHGFLAGGDTDRRLQLAQRLADIYDQYQVYRADWLADWAAGLDRLRQPAGGAQPLAAAQVWQAALWRAILDDIARVGDDGAAWTHDDGTAPPGDLAAQAPASIAGRRRSEAAGRAQVHTRFVEALSSGAAPARPLPRRVILFGASTLPRQTLEALHALSRRCQVIIAIPNPCRFHWADTIDGRELLKAQRRQSLREGRDLAQVPLDDLHAYANPLLAGWGRQGRDFIRLLDGFEQGAPDDGAAVSRIDLFTEDEGQTLLQQVQAAVRDLEPPAAEDARRGDPGDASIVFHVAHSALREVEILHDQLLEMFRRAPADAPLAPRDIVIMVPAIEDFAPAVRAVFGQYGRGDPRYIPFDIVDLRARGLNPLLVALEWLLRLPRQRCRLSDIQALLDVPALARRFGLEKGDIQRLSQWMTGAGVRWGLSSRHRRNLGLHACGEQNSWLFGLRRMLLGYASGGGATFADIEPYEEIGGLDASLAGSLAALVAVLERWERRLAQTLTPAQWGECARELLADCFAADDENDTLTLAALQAALHGWLSACTEAGFAQGVPLDVLREAWLGALDEPTVNQAFMARGVSFCTLMPMRAIPFEVVGLLGMNDADYPRRVTRVDFDLMALPGAQRPGDRSRRDDDRYLMLEALLSARRTLYVSWSGRSVRDNSTQPPSVLVAQLRDYLATSWDPAMLARLTTEHPLQPFSARYFEGGRLFTYAREWRAAHDGAGVAGPASPDARGMGGTGGMRETNDSRDAGDDHGTRHDRGGHDGRNAHDDNGVHDAGNTPDDPNQAGTEPPLTLAMLVDFLRNPVKHFFRYRLDVVFDRRLEPGEDDECFALDRLDEHLLIGELLDGAALACGDDEAALAARLDARAAAIARAGRLPLGVFGARARERLVGNVLPIWRNWREQSALWATPADKEPLAYQHRGARIEDWLDGLWLRDGQRAWLELSAYRLMAGPAPRADLLLTAWVRQLVASACGLSIDGIIVGRDAVLTTHGIERARATALLDDLLDAWREGMRAPLPFACKTALAALGGDAAAAKAYEGDFTRRGEVDEPCLARTFARFDDLLASGAAEGRTLHYYVARLFEPMNDWIARAVALEVYPDAAPDEDAETVDIADGDVQ